MSLGTRCAQCNWLLQEGDITLCIFCLRTVSQENLNSSLGPKQSNLVNAEQRFLDRQPDPIKRDALELLNQIKDSNEINDIPEIEALRLALKSFLGYK